MKGFKIPLHFCVAILFYTRDWLHFMLEINVDHLLTDSLLGNAVSFLFISGFCDHGISCPRVIHPVNMLMHNAAAFFPSAVPIDRLCTCTCRRWLRAWWGEIRNTTYTLSRNAKNIVNTPNSVRIYCMFQTARVIFTYKNTEDNTVTSECLRSQIYKWLNNNVGAGIAQSVQRLATGWKVRGSNPGGAEIFRFYPDRLRGPSSLLYNAYRVFPGSKGGRGVALTTHPHLVPRYTERSKAIPLLSLRAFVAL
jgi:hypothetical protein